MVIKQLIHVFPQNLQSIKIKRDTQKKKNKKKKKEEEERLLVLELEREKFDI